ncbi:MAG: hypothetical protein WC710_11590 [Gallionella sp.]|jgi:hypothetical protein
MKLDDREVLRQIDTLFPLRARLVTRHNGDKGRFELTDVNGKAVLIEGVSALRIIALLRLHNYAEAFEEIAAFDGELVFSKPVTRAERSTKRPYNEMDDQPPFSYFF